MNTSSPTGTKVTFETVELGDVAFEVPSNWIEDSAVTSFQPGASTRATLTLSRMSVAPDENVETTVAKRLTEIYPTVPFEVLETRRAQAAGHWGMEVVLSLPSENEGDLVIERMMFMRAPDAVWLMCGSTTKQQGRAALVHFDQALATLQLPKPRGGW